MSKYDALGDFLRNQNVDHVPMTFREIEKVTGTKLPGSKCYPAWWSNNAWNNVMTKVWLDAGFKSEQVDIAHERLVFRRDVSTARASRRAEPHLAWKEDHHPIVGALKGTFTIERDWDLTKPALDADESQELEKSAERTANLVDAGFRKVPH